MYTRIFNFFNKNNFFYLLQFGFRQNDSTTHALISLTVNIGKYLDEGNFVCCILMGLDRSFDAVERDILLTMLEHFGARGPGND